MKLHSGLHVVVLPLFFLFLFLQLSCPVYGEPSPDNLRKTGDLLGITEKKFQRIALDVEIPQRIAVLAATGDGENNVRNDIRTAVYNHMSSLPYHLIKPFVVDERLKEAKGKNIGMENTPDELAKLLDVQGLLFVHVDKVERLFVAAYAHYKIKVTISLYSTKEDKIIWKDSRSVIERSGGVPFDPIGLIATIVTSGLVLSDSIRIMLTDKIGRQFAQVIPIPEGGANYIAVPKLTLATTNAVEGPFRTGEEVRIGVVAEPGLVATFSLGSLHEGLPLHENEPGKYIGSWVIPAEKIEQHVIATVVLINPETRSRLEWNIPGAIDIDTVAPSALIDLHVKPVENGVQLIWKGVGSTNAIDLYVIERRVEGGEFTIVAKSESSVFNDVSIEMGKHYHYRIHAVDLAGNKGSSRVIEMTAIHPGPTYLSNDIENDYTLYTYGSPYVVDGILTVLPNTTLTIHAGVVIQMKKNSQLLIRGRMIAFGAENKLIRIEGAMLHIDFKGESSLLENVSIKGGSTAIKVSSHLQMTHVAIIEVGNQFVNQQEADAKVSEKAKMTSHPALLIDGQANVLLNDVLLQGQDTGILMNGGELELNHVQLVTHHMALKVTGISHLKYDNLLFKDNRIHVDSTVPLTFKRLFFKDSRFNELINKVQNKATISWAQSATGRNLMTDWLVRAMKGLTQTVALEGMKKAVEESIGMAQLAHSSESRHISEVMQTIFSGDLPKVYEQRSFETLKSFTRGKYAHDENLHYWIQEVGFIVTEGDAAFGMNVMEMTNAKMNSAYLRYRFPRASPIKLRRALHSFESVKYTPVNFILTQIKTRKHLRVWVLRGTYDKLIDPFLMASGLIKRSLSNINIAVSGEVNSRTQWRKIMKIHNIKLKDLDYNDVNEALASAEKMGFDYILQFSVISHGTISSLSSRLHVVNGSLNIAVYDVKQKIKIKVFSKKERGSGFSQEKAERKMVRSGLNHLQSNVLDFLSSLSSLP